MAGLFEYIREALPAGIVRRGVVYGLAMWAISYVFFETWVPLNALGEPLPLVGLELLLEAVGMTAVGVTISRLLRDDTGTTS